GKSSERRNVGRTDEETTRAGASAVEQVAQDRFRDLDWLAERRTVTGHAHVAAEGDKHVAADDRSTDHSEEVDRRLRHLKARLRRRRRLHTAGPNPLELRVPSLVREGRRQNERNRLEVV